MSRSPLFHRFSRTVSIAWFAERNRISTGDALERVAAAEDEAQRRRSRREFLGDIARATASGALAAVAGPLGRADASAASRGSGGTSTVNVAIVGAGMAGLACADRLKAAGIFPTVYEATSRVGGRVRSLPGVFP